MLLVKNPVQHNNTKHIGVRHHYVRECVVDGAITLRPVASANNMADICPTPLGKVILSFLHSLLGLVRLPDAE